MTYIKQHGSESETDEQLRRLYGEQAVFSHLGRFTLIHLDSPSREQLARREAEFNPNDFFFDDCPLCEAAKNEGGHIVYDHDDEDDPLRAQSYGVDVTDAEQVTRSPAAMFDLALLNLLTEAEEFGGELEGAVSEELIERYGDDVSDLHDRLIETLWAEESAQRIEVFERQFARAQSTIDAVCEAAPSLAPKARAVREALDAIAAVWRGL